MSYQQVFWTGANLSDGTARNILNALPRLHDLRFRMVQRGIRAIALQPQWCAIRDGACNISPWIRLLVVVERMWNLHGSGGTLTRGIAAEGRCFFGELTYYYYPPKCRYWSVLCVQWQKKIMICQDHALINCDFAPTCPSCTKCNKIGEKVQNTKLNDARRDRTLLLVLVLTGDSNRFLLKIVISDQILYLSFDSRKSHA